MAIGTDALIDFFGTQDVADDTSTSTISSGAFSVAADVASWTNDDDAPAAGFTLECQFDTTMPTVGHIGLFAHILNVQSTNDTEIPATNHLSHWLGNFKIPFSVAADTNFHAAVPYAVLPNMITSQVYDFYIYNFGTSQTIGVDWNLWVTPLTKGPHA